MDYATRYPEAIALPSIETERVAEALVEMFSRVGVPDEMLTDCGSQFTSEVLLEVARLLSLQQLTTSAFHAQVMVKWSNHMQRLSKCYEEYALNTQRIGIGTFLHSCLQ